MPDLSLFATDMAAADGRMIQQGHADYCAAHGHAFWIVDGVYQGRCARCGDDMTSTEESATRALMPKITDERRRLHGLYTFAVESTETVDDYASEYLTADRTGIDLEFSKVSSIERALADLDKIVGGVDEIFQTGHDDLIGRLAIELSNIQADARYLARAIREALVKL